MTNDNPLPGIEAERTCLKIKAVLFDFGNTIIEQRHDFAESLDRMNLRLIAGVFETVNVLKVRYKLGLVSNTSQTTGLQVLRALESLGIADAFQAVVTSVDVGCKKPCARIFEASLDLLRVQPGESLMIGNDLEEDIRGAKGAGLKGGLFDPQGEHRDDSFPDFRFGAMEELSDAIELFERRSS